MTLPVSGPISLGAIQTEYGGSNPTAINEYYRGGLYVPNASPNLGVPTSGAISLNQFYGGAAASTLKNSLVSYWEFEDGPSSSICLDSHTGGNTLSHTVDALTSVPGIIGTSYFTRQQAAKASPTGSISSGVSIGYWVRKQNVSDSPVVLFSNGTTSPTVIWGWASGFFRVTALASTFPDNYITYQVSPLSAITTSWKFYVGTYSSSTRILTAYVNGVQTNTASGPSSFGSLYPNTGSGRQLTLASSGNFCEIDQAFLYSRAITLAEVQALYNGGAGRSYASL